MPNSSELRALPVEGTEVPSGSVRSRPGLHPAGLLVGALFFCASFLPSMLPRSWVKQGTITGISLATGYAIGVAILTLLGRRRPNPVRWHPGWYAVGGTCVLFVVLGVGWEEQVRGATGADAAPTWESLAGVVFSLGVAWILIMLGRLIVRLANRLDRWLGRFAGRRLATLTSSSVALLVVIGVIQGVVVKGTFAAVSATYRTLSQETSPWITQPRSPLRTGSAESLVPWDTLGRHGREFVGSGPTATDIGRFTRRAAEEPIRVYVGVDSAPTLEERVELLLTELDRVEAFERAHLAIITATGTGWVDEVAVEAFEFLHEGDTAVAVMQYSHTPSWVLFFGDRAVAAETASAMISAVTDRLGAVPNTTRPHLSVFGESLGALGVVLAFDDVADLLERTDSALLVGAPDSDPIRATLVESRDPGSPRWLPVIDERPEIVFAAGPDHLSGVDADVVYLQYASDPVGYASFDLILERPDWLDRPRGPDLTPAMTWIPFVTFLQSLGDIGFAMDVPEGHGHHYGLDIVDAWAALDAPPDWTEKDTARLRSVVQDRKQERESRADS